MLAGGSSGPEAGFRGTRRRRQLSVKGVRIELDDFGTGYASLTHLRALPVYLVKIDPSFIKHIDQHAGTA